MFIYFIGLVGRAANVIIYLLKFGKHTLKMPFSINNNIHI